MPTAIAEFKMIYKDPEILEYIQSLTEQEKQTLQIAYDHLETSFNIYKSIGYLKWKASVNESK